MSNILVNMAYFPPVQYVAKIKECAEIWIEQYESYGKQSYRNRCDIMTANGVMTLSVPVMKGSSVKMLTKDVQVDYSTNWQKLHAFFRTEGEVSVGSQHQNSTRAHG